MKYSETGIKGLWVIEPQRFGDKRGYFMETFRLDEFTLATGTDVSFVQDNESLSSRGVLRGLHFQRGSFSQAKLVRVSMGRVLDVAVDLRPGSPTLGRYFAHGFMVLSETAVFQYKVDNFYAPQAEATLQFNDPDIGIAWPEIEGGYNISPKDLDALPLRLAAEIVAVDP